MFYLFYLAIWLSLGTDYSVWDTDITSLLLIFYDYIFISSIVHSIQGLKDVEDDYFTKEL